MDDELSTIDATLEGEEEEEEEDDDDDDDNDDDDDDDDEEEEAKANDSAVEAEDEDWETAVNDFCPDVDASDACTASTVVPNALTNACTADSVLAIASPIRSGPTLMERLCGDRLEKATLFTSFAEIFIGLFAS